MPDVKSNGVRIHYEVAGEGDPVVLLHGMIGSHEAWVRSGWWDALPSHGFRAIGIDARSCGASEFVDDPDRFVGGPCVGDVASVLDDIGIDHADVVGYSMGAGHALRLALERPERVRSIVLGGLGGIALSIAGLYAQSAMHSRECLVRGGQLISEAATRVGAEAKRYVEAYFEALQRDRLADGELEALDVPTLIVVGENDTYQGDFAAVAITEMLERRIPGARRLVLDGADHMSAMGDPRFLDAGRAFLGRHGEG